MAVFVKSFAFGAAEVEVSWIMIYGCHRKIPKDIPHEQILQPKLQGNLNNNYFRLFQVCNAKSREECGIRPTIVNYSLKDPLDKDVFLTSAKFSGIGDEPTAIGYPLGEPGPAVNRRGSELDAAKRIMDKAVMLRDAGETFERHL